MSITVYDLERTVNSGLTTAVKMSKVSYGQLLIEINIEDIYSTILYLKTNDKCRFKQLIDITAVDYPNKEKRFSIVYLLLCVWSLQYTDIVNDNKNSGMRF